MTDVLSYAMPQGTSNYGLLLMALPPLIFKEMMGAGRILDPRHL